jgi:hypothetical protein
MAASVRPGKTHRLDLHQTALPGFRLNDAVQQKKTKGMA